MTKQETQHFIDTILRQQATIQRQSETIHYLETLIDSLAKELELCRKEGRV